MTHLSPYPTYSATSDAEARLAALEGQVRKHRTPCGDGEMVCR